VRPHGNLKEVNNMSRIDIYKQLQDQLIEPHKLCEIDVETITPLLIGGYDGKTYHGNTLSSETLRATSIKGVWRWWARALIAAAIVKKLGKYPRYLNIVDSYLSKIFGSTQKQSKYSIAITNSSKSEQNIYDDIENNKSLSKVPRIKLLKMRKEMSREQFIKPGIRFQIVIYRIRDTNNIENQFAIWSLIMSLIFDGIGKATSRGFGKLKINRVNVMGEFMELEEVIQKLYSSNTHEDIRKYLKEVINNAVNSAEKIVENLKINDKDLSEEPYIEIPLIDERLMILEVPNKRFEDYINVLKVIGNASLKLYYKAIMHVKEKISIKEAKQRSFKESGKNVHTWILGLPRSQEPLLIQDREEKIEKLKKQLKNKLDNLNLSSEALLNRIKFDKRGIRVPTGYYYLMGENIKLRRRSSVRFTTVKTNSNYFFIVIYAFKTFDWNEKIYHLVHIGVNYKKQNFEVTRIMNISIDNVINTIVHNAKEIIEKDVFGENC
jgi:CRISPR type III-B/RAMP module RAMP protein Cmr1